MIALDGSRSVPAVGGGSGWRSYLDDEFCVHEFKIYLQLIPASIHTRRPVTPSVSAPVRS